MENKTPYRMYNGIPPHVSGSDTSFGAATCIARHIDNLHDRITTFIDQIGGATCDEVERLLGLSHQTASARIRELTQLGRLRDSGERRKTRTGRNARVYTI